MNFNGVYNVQFDETKNEVHRMITWNYAYRCARENMYERLARDRLHFQRRIKRISIVLNCVLTEKHRQKIYCERFMRCKYSK